MKTQEQHYYDAVRKNAEADRTFLILVKKWHDQNTSTKKY